MMFNCDNFTNVVRYFDDLQISNVTIEGEAHRTPIRIFLSMDATIAVCVVVISTVNVIITTGNENIQPELHSFLCTLGQQQPLGMTTAWGT